MLSEKFPEEVGSQPEDESLLEASFLREMGGHTLFKNQIGIKRCLLRDCIPRGLNSVKSCNSQESSKLPYGMGGGEQKIGLMHL
jgi:hypothetical protein